MKKYRPEIDGLRAIAILSVILFHAGFLWMQGGFLGVDVFFVISGYLITQVIAEELDQGSFHFGHFWLRRARRILPALICMVLVSFLVAWFLFLPDDFKNMGRSGIALSVFVSNIYFWLKSGYFAPPAATEPFLHTWSLGVEEQFYLLFPLLFYALTRCARVFRTTLIFSFMFLSFILMLLEIKQYEIATFFLLPMRAWELLLGSVAALYFLKKENDWPDYFNTIGSSLGLFMIGVAVLFYNQNASFSAWGQIVACVGAVSIIATNQSRLTGVGRLLSHRFLVGIGLISYSLYLWHWPLLVFASYVSVVKLTSSQVILILLVSVALAWLSYRWIETPFRQKHILAQAKTFTLVAILMSALIAGIGLLVDLKNGFPNRLSPSIFNVYEAAQDQPLASCKIINISKNLSICTNAPLNQNPDLIIWGDSHAYMLLPLIEKMAAQYHLKYWSYSCIPVLDVYTVSESKSLADSSCTASNHDMMQLIRQRHLKNVLFSSFWEQFVEGREIPIEGAGQRDPFYADANIKSSTPEQARAVFEKHFIDTVDQLEGMGVHIWIVKDVPFFQFWPSNQLVKILKYGGNPNEIGRPLSELTEREAFVDSVFNQIKSSEVTFINPDSILCDAAGFCHGARDGQSLYFDFNHLSVYGVMQLEPLFKPMVVLLGHS